MQDGHFSFRPLTGRSVLKQNPWITSKDAFTVSVPLRGDQFLNNCGSGQSGGGESFRPLTGRSVLKLFNFFDCATINEFPSPYGEISS